jgi:TolB protein
MVLWLITLAFAADPPREVASFDGANAQRPTWSPDGRLVSVEANDHEARTVHLHVGDPLAPLKQVQPVGSAPSDLTAAFATTTASTAVAHDLAWAPSSLGQRFVYVAADRSKDYDIHLHQVGPVVQGPGADGGPSWSPDGHWLVFTSARSGQGDLYLLDVQQIAKPPRRLTSLPDGSELYPTWSADGQQLVYVAHSSTGDHLYWLPGLDQAPIQLTDWSGSQIRPRFAPSGRSIAFYANHEQTDRFDLYIVEARAGAPPRKLASGVLPDGNGPSWTPEGGALIAVLDDDTRFDPVVRVALSGDTTVLNLGTVGHADLAVTQRDGQTWLAWIAQGRASDSVRDFKRLFVAPLP